MTRDRGANRVEDVAESEEKYMMELVGELVQVATSAARLGSIAGIIHPTTKDQV